MFVLFSFLRIPDPYLLGDPQTSYQPPQELTLSWAPNLNTFFFLYFVNSKSELDWIFFSQVMFELFIQPVEPETTVWEKMISNMWDIIYVKLYSVDGDKKVKN